MYRETRMLARWCAVVALVTAVGLGGPADADGVPTLTAQALTALEPGPPTPEVFNFCVLGDTRVPGLAEVFPRNVREMNLLCPSFIVDVGDLIPGYTSDASAINRQWDEFDAVVATSQAPLIPVVGNHDCWDWQSRRIYRQRMGPPAFSFDYGNSHFVCLDSEEPGHINQIGPAQLEWLEQDLQRHAGYEHLFVFVHRPLWTMGNSNWKSEVHPLLLEHNVSAVFAGHVHIYLFQRIDGVPYYITGGGGAELHLGSFYHFLHVAVRDDRFTTAVVKTGNLEKEDFLLEETAAPAAE